MLLTSATWSMNHHRTDNAVQMWLPERIWDLCRNELVYRLWITKLVLWLQEDEQVHVREPPLLEFDGVDLGHCLSQDMIFEDIVEECILLYVKDSGHDVWSI